MNLTNIKVSIFKDLKSYESRPVGLQEVLWYLQNDRDVDEGRHDASLFGGGALQWQWQADHSCYPNNRTGYL